MKKVGSKFEYEEERDRNLLRVYHKLVSETKFINTTKLYESISRHPSDRFWVSEERAAIVVSQIARGDKLLCMKKNKRDMFFEIYRRVVQMQKEYPQATLKRIIFRVVRETAPSFYLTEGSIKVIMSRIKTQWYKRKLLTHRK